MKGVILDAGSLGEATDLTPITNLLDSWDIHAATQPEDVTQRIRDASVVLSNKVPVSASNLAGSQVRYISVMATGTNNIDMDYARANNIAVSNAVAYATPSVVQHTLSLMLNLATSMPGYIKRVKQGDWQESDVFCLVEQPIVELAGKTLGIVGYGELGSSVARAAQALGMEVIVSARPKPVEKGLVDKSLDENNVASAAKREDAKREEAKQKKVKRVKFEEMLKAADLVSLHCPLTDDNQGMINEKTLALMKPTAFLINTARGGLVSSPALLDALRQGVIAGAAVDVLTREPPGQDEPLLSENLPNLIVTPHNAWASVESRQRLVNQMKENIEGFLKGKIPRLLTH